MTVAGKVGRDNYEQFNNWFARANGKLQRKELLG